MRLRHKMILLIAGPTLLIYAVILGFVGMTLYGQSRREAERAMSRLAASYSARLDGYLREAARVATTSAGFMELADRMSDEEVYQRLEGNVKQMQLIYGACAAFEPGTRKPEGELFAPYACRSSEGLRRVNIDRSVYDWHADPQYTWYSRPKQLGHGVWSEPYFDEGAGNILMSTYSAPFKAGKLFGGVCTVDIDLPSLQQTVGKELAEDLDFVILAADGRYVYHPDSTRIMAKTVMDYAHEARQPEVAAMSVKMLSGAAGASWIDGWDGLEPLGVFYTPISSTGWVFACRMPAEQVLRDVRHRVVVGGSALVVALLLMAGCIYVVAGMIAAPIAALERKVSEVSRGELEARIDEYESTHEIRSLARAFNTMTNDLRAHVQRLAVERAERERIERDMDIARGIQQGLLPTTTPNIPGFEIAGWNKPADKTGGDYYDWQELPDGRLAVVIADVTGHGIGPALLMAVCRAYARASVPHVDPLRAAMVQLNRLVSDDFTDGRFVTFAVAVLSPNHDEIELLSAGHGPTLLFRKFRGKVEALVADGMPLGIMSDMEFPEPQRIRLTDGDALLFLTDGFIEAHDAANELFGLERLSQAFASCADRPMAEILSKLDSEVRAFCGTRPPEDDMTAVIIRRMA